MAAPTLDELAALRAAGAVHRVSVPGSGESWLVVTRDAARAALTDPRLRNDIRHSASWDSDGGHAIGHNMLQSDPPQHTRLRHLVAGHFTPGRIAALRPRVERVAGDLLDALPRRGTADLVARYALPLPVTLICELLGVPGADREVFHTWSNELVMPTSPGAAEAAAGALTGCLTDLTGAKRDAPDGTLLGDLAAAADAGDLTAEELLGMAFLILVAGHETTVNLISATVHSLLTHPGQLDRLRAEPDLAGERWRSRCGSTPPCTPPRSVSRPSRWSWRAHRSRPATRCSSPRRRLPRSRPLPRPRPLRHRPCAPRPPRLRPRHPPLPGRPAGPGGGHRRRTPAPRAVPRARVRHRPGDAHLAHEHPAAGAGGTAAAPGLTGSVRTGPPVRRTAGCGRPVPPSRRR